MDTAEIICSCTGKLEEHTYVVDTRLLSDGYLCSNCNDFKDLNEVGEDYRSDQSP